MNAPQLRRVFAALVILGGCCHPALAETSGTKHFRIPAVDPADPPAVILYTRVGMEKWRLDPSLAGKLPSYEHNRVRVAAWTDGRVVWSHNISKGGSPYFSGKTTPEKVREIYRILETETSATAHQHTFHAMPDAASTNIELRLANTDYGISWTSAHPNYESPALRFSSTGLSSADSFDPAAPLTQKEIEFQHFRKDFDRMTSAILTLPPAEEMRFQ